MDAGNFVFILLLQIENMAVFPKILFSRLTFMNFYKKSQINAEELALN